MNETRLVQQLGEALRDAYQYISYQGFGRACDSEISPPSGLREQICSALDAWEAEPRPHLLRARVAGDTIRDLIEALQQLDPDLKHGVEEVVRAGGECQGLGKEQTELVEHLQSELSEAEDLKIRYETALEKIADADESTASEIQEIAREALL